ncbi:DUF1759 domain-containing protein [Wolbachia endosymbiont of Psylliodes chrysocephala]|uniref:DUF1759 domain-containing protein n=1 Tax=Wolbachia endosymbiont of Psylliodes chrysocephala TaxID=2883236 RepID=UPI00209F6987|nr:DUF1759 domain-containing protein [Wolbachia endosymbiont of Psylliodes chrysocephala]
MAPDTTAEKIRNLVKRRSILKGQLTRFESFLNSFDNVDITQLEIRLKRIEIAFEEFETIQTDLELLDSSEESSRTEFEDNYYNLIAKAKMLILTVKPSVSENSLIENVSPNNSNLKLPPIRLPVFTGDYQTWTTFHDTFNRLIHQNENLRNVEKLHHLKTCLKDLALKLVANLETTDDNYNIAWNLLVERFENKRLMINNHIKDIINLPNLTRTSPTVLRELTDNVHSHVCALEKLGLESKAWEWVLIYIVSSKFDHATNLAWEDSLNPSELPTYQMFKTFLTKRSFSLENAANNSLTHKASQSYSKNHFHSHPKPIATLSVTENTNLMLHTMCQLCKQNHFIYQCPEFSKLSVEQRYNHAKTFKLCTNCLRPGHRNQDCRSGQCKICNKNHNTLLHKNNQVNQMQLPHNSQSHDSNLSYNLKSNQAPRTTQGPKLTENIKCLSPAQSNSKLSTDITQRDMTNVQEASQTLHSISDSQRPYVLLSTAQILIHDKYGNIHVCRAILDSGSQSNLISNSLCEKLGLDKVDILTPIIGVNQIITNIKYKAKTLIKSRTSAFMKELSFLVLPKLTERIPSFDFDINLFPLINNKTISLADPNFNLAQDIDLLLGANIFYELLCPNQIKLRNSNLILQETTLGWIFTGTIYLNHLNDRNICNFSREADTNVSNESLNELLKKFWEIEEVPNKPILSPEAQLAEQYYSQTTTRDSNGKFIVRLPFSCKLETYGDSYATAVKQFNRIEGKLSKNEDLKHDYIQFMNEYKNLGHMTLISNADVNTFLNQPSYILPHHAVIKQTSTTTKCRIVFNASSRTNIGVSLNDTLLIGYSVQHTLFSIITRLRLRKYVLNADIKMMFRQIWIHPDDRRYQMILWRDNEHSNLDLYTLNTVTYGTASAPFLATRTLYELATLFEGQYPRTCQIIKTSIYMDDLLVSLESFDEALEVFREIFTIFESAGLQFRKWSSNDPCILKEILKYNNNDNSDRLVEFHDDKELKTLGVAWKTDTDTFNYAVNLDVRPNACTKRIVLSTISKLFDPLGLVGPIIIRAKVFMQHLWRKGIKWDDPLPDELRRWWNAFLNQLREVRRITISRQVLCDEPQLIQMHGFCDASESAYGACIYLVSNDRTGKKHSNLLCAKSKVAPQAKCTLPRLELLSAVLLAKLVAIMQTVLDIKVPSTTFYTDSTIVLSWLRLDPSTLKTFVANRVAKIIELTDMGDWKHVVSKDNAADVISRGLTPQELCNSDIWWHGPNFLLEDEDVYSTTPLPKQSLEQLPEIKHSQSVILTLTNDDFDIFNRFSSLSKLLSIVSYCFRFKLVTKNKQKFQSLALTPTELETTLMHLIKLSQAQSYFEEIRYLKTSGTLRSTSKLLCLNPFLDNSGTLRVGGRLNNADIEYSQKFPIILPKGHALTRLIIMHEHIKNLHAGTQNLLAIMRLKFWPIDGKTAIKGVIRTCIKCFKSNPKTAKFLMGNLPVSRVTPSRPFSRCGLDYCGPILIKDSTLRKPKLVKAYICIFVCFAIRAVHIELVRDLSTDSFLNALKRFISRRGKPFEIFSDNGTNFVGARNHLMSYIICFVMLIIINEF